MEGQASPKRAKASPDLDASALGDNVGLSVELPAGDDQPTDAEAEADALIEQELRSVQAQLDKEHEEMTERWRQVEHEFNQRKQPLYKARGRVIQQIPGFWLHCFMQHEDIRMVLGAVDQDILGRLTEVMLQLEVEPFDDVKAGYKLILGFAENDFFHDRELVKEIRFRHDPGEQILCSVSGCSPKWKGEDPTRTEPEKSGRKRGREEEDAVTFFRWFTQANTFERGLIDTLADIIKEQLWVNPLEFMDSEEPEDPIILEDDDDEEEEEADVDDDLEGYEGAEGEGAEGLVWEGGEGEEPLSAEPELEDYEEYDEGEGVEGEEGVEVDYGDAPPVTGPETVEGAAPTDPEQPSGPPV